jgi:pimeloyl-ACP methyl ester carboxylesterase
MIDLPGAGHWAHHDCLEVVVLAVREFLAA